MEAVTGSDEALQRPSDDTISTSASQSSACHAPAPDGSCRAVTTEGRRGGRQQDGELGEAAGGSGEGGGKGEGYVEFDFVLPYGVCLGLMAMVVVFLYGLCC